MSRFALSLLVITLPMAALADELGPRPGESNDQVVSFDVNERLFRGRQFEVGYDLTESGPGVWLYVDVTTDLEMAMEGRSMLEWPEVLANSWEQTEKGGSITLRNVGRAWIEIRGRVAGIDLAYTLWEESLRWTETFELRSLLLQGTRQGRTISLSPQGDALFDFETEFEVFSDDVRITLGAAIRPFLGTVITGNEIEVDDGRNMSRVQQTRQETTVAPPDTNDGWTDFSARWHGDMSGVMGLRTTPRIEVKVGRTTIGPLTFPLDLDIFSDTTTLRSSWSDVVHDLPAARPAVASLDFGQVVVGDKGVREFTIRNHGNVELSGLATVEGAGFILPRTNLLLPRNNNASPTEQTFSLDFLPDDIGNFTGSLVLHTNDPVRPYITVPMVGVGIAPSDNGNGGGNPNDPGDGSLVTQQGRGCGCSAVSPATGLGGLGLLGLLGLVARRRR